MLTARFLLARCCPFFRCRLRVPFVRLLAFFAVPAMLAGQVLQPKDIVTFHLRSGYLIVVQTMVNGEGPFNFLLDTGTTRIVIDPGLARQLQAPVIGEVSLTGVLRVRQDQMVQLNDVRLGAESQSGMWAVVDTLERQKMLAPGIRGILGEDFLSKFDLLIDYKQRRLHFGATPPAGERCRFESIGQHQGSPTTNRLLITSELVQVSGAKVQLQLDTGAKVPELFPASRESLPSERKSGFIATSSGTDGVTVYSNITLRIGSTTVSGLNVVQSRQAMAFDAAGLLPAAIFRTIYISHSGGFVIFNPSE